MDSMILLKIGGIFHFVFAAFHIMFWKLFKWKEELSKINRLNCAIMQVLNLCLTLCFIFFGFISICYTEELISSGIGHALLVFIALFWLIRAVEQFLFFDYKRPVSIVLIISFLFVIFLYIYPLLFDIKHG